jgi:uncharacterized protein YdhG (YjbR/CyaY superfamily)
MYTRLTNRLTTLSSVITGRRRNQLRLHHHSDAAALTVSQIKSRGETISMTTVEAALKTLPKVEPPKPRFQCETDAYIFSQPENIQVLLCEVRLRIREALPDATEKMAWGMPTYWQGRNIIHFAAQKNHLGIYPGEEAIKHFAAKLAGYRTSKGAIQFPYKTFRKEQLALIIEIATWCGKENAG